MAMVNMPAKQNAAVHHGSANDSRHAALQTVRDAARQRSTGPAASASATNPSSITNGSASASRCKRRPKGIAGHEGTNVVGAVGDPIDDQLDGRPGVGGGIKRVASICGVGEFSTNRDGGSALPEADEYCVFGGEAHSR
jgi:hypothetical protein